MSVAAGEEVPAVTEVPKGRFLVIDLNNKIRVLRRPVIFAIR